MAALDDALEILEGKGPEYHGSLSNHGPMGAEALAALDRTDAVVSWTEAYEKRLLDPPARRRWIGPADWREALATPVLVFVGRADDARKNLPLLLEAFATLREIHPDARLRLVGAPPAGAQPEGVDVVGCVDDVAPELRKAALFVLPSLQEEAVSRLNTLLSKRV